MIIQCGGCGLVANIKHDGTENEIEQSIHNAIEVGWRWSTSHDVYICPQCSRNGSSDTLYQAYAGRIRKANKANSYRRLLLDIAGFIEDLRRI